MIPFMDLDNAEDGWIAIRYARDDQEQQLRRRVLTMDIYQLVADYRKFWETHFPEQKTISREKANQRVGTPYLEWLLNPAQLRQFQDGVAPIYGAWTLDGYQLSFMKALLLHLATTTTGGTLLSLGSGPASLELFLLSRGLVDRCILVD